MGRKKTHKKYIKKMSTKKSCCYIHLPVVAFYLPWAIGKPLLFNPGTNTLEKENKTAVGVINLERLVHC